MSRFNLLDEPWIRVTVDDMGNMREVSLTEFFSHAHEYRELAGDTGTQDFAVLRILLAVLHTVFSRFDETGTEYGFFDVDERWKQISKIDSEDLQEYRSVLLGTWSRLWDGGSFPAVINEYLEKWRDRFWLFDDKYPFMQVTETIITDGEGKINASPFDGKNINRTISESGNKVSWFSPKTEKYKEVLTAAEAARWLITLHGYIGTSDKKNLKKTGATSSKGWLYDIGGIYLKADTLFRTLMLNFYITNQESNNLLNVQKPCWEYTPEEVLEDCYMGTNAGGAAQLYTAWSRAIYIDENIDLNKGFTCSIAKIPEIRHEDQFLEDMTVWRYDKKENHYRPVKHRFGNSLWRSFGLITLADESRKPGIIDWLDKIQKLKEEIGKGRYSVCAVSMEDDGNATSWVPTNEIKDELTLAEFILTDLAENGWTKRVNDVIELTKSVIDVTYRRYLNDIKAVRNLDKSDFVTEQAGKLYYLIDTPFRQWLAGIDLGSSKEEKTEEWKRTLKSIILKQAEDISLNGSARDYRGIEDGSGIKNIATAYNHFILDISRQLN